MNSNFVSGFEKTAFLGALVKGGVNLAKRLGKKFTGNMVTTGKNGRKLKKAKWQFSAGKTGLSTVGGVFALSEVADVAHKTKTTSNAMKSIQNLPRPVSVSRGIGRAAY